LNPIIRQQPGCATTRPVPAFVTPRGQHGIFAGARRYLRLLRSLVKNQVPYLAPAGRGRGADPEALAAAAQDTWQILQQKWRAIPGGLDLIADEAHPLGFWRRLVKEIHHLHLPTRP
jgi:hypothetical protein